MRFSRASLVALPLLLSVTSVFGQQTAWLTPDGSKPDYTDAFRNADVVTLQWDRMTGGLSDLWLNAVESNYAMRLGSNINISSTTGGTYPWTITVGSEEIDVDSHFQLSFVPIGTSYNKENVGNYEQSPRFILVKEGAALPTTTATSSSSSAPVATSNPATSTSSAATSTTTPSSVPEEESNTLSTGVKVGAGIAVVAGVAIIIGLLFWALRLRRKVKAVNNHRSSGIVPSSGVMPKSSAQPTEKRIPGLHETHGDMVQPVEMSVRPKTVYHEMAG